MTLPLNNCREVILAAALLERLRFKEMNMLLDHTRGNCGSLRAALETQQPSAVTGDSNRWPDLIREQALAWLCLCVVHVCT